MWFWNSQNLMRYLYLRLISITRNSNDFDCYFEIFFLFCFSYFHSNYSSSKHWSILLSNVKKKKKTRIRIKETMNFFNWIPCNHFDCIFRLSNSAKKENWWKRSLREFSKLIFSWITNVVSLSHHFYPSLHFSYSFRQLIYHWMKIKITDATKVSRLKWNCNEW